MSLTQAPKNPAFNTLPGVKDGSQERPIEELDRVNRDREQVAVGPQANDRGCIRSLA